MSHVATNHERNTMAVKTDQDLKSLPPKLLPDTNTMAGCVARNIVVFAQKFFPEEPKGARLNFSWIGLDASYSLTTRRRGAELAGDFLRAYGWQLVEVTSKHAQFIRTSDDGRHINPPSDEPVKKPYKAPAIESKPLAYPPHVVKAAEALTRALKHEVRQNIGAMDRDSFRAAFHLAALIEGGAA